MFPSLRPYLAHVFPQVPLGKGRRCVVLADGFYEWQRCQRTNRTQPYFIYFPQIKTEKVSSAVYICVCVFVCLVCSLSFLHFWFDVFPIFLKILSHYLFNYFFCPIFSSLSGILIIYVLDGLILSHSFWMFSYVYFILFSLCFSLSDFY